jgi:SOS-response transcriptional repressor LexA
MTPGQRIKSVRLSIGMSQQALAKAISEFGDRRSVSRTTITQWETGSTRGIEAANLLKAAKALDVMPEWLQFGTGHMKPPRLNLEGLAPIACNALSVPILKHAQAGNHREVMEQQYAELSIIGIDQELAKVASPHAFALEIKGDSMAPLFKPGDIVIIDPDVKPKPGEYVVAKLQKNNVILLRKYRPLGNAKATNSEKFELSAINEDWPAITVDNKNPGEIVGTLIEHRCQRRIGLSEETETYYSLKTETKATS